MRHIFLVAYDMSDDANRNKVFNKLKGYGEALQYSLFRCALSPCERLNLRAELWDLINHATDRVILVDLGPDHGRGRQAIESWGKPLHDPAEHDGMIIL